jgi:hypothetical protein
MLGRALQNGGPSQFTDAALQQREPRGRDYVKNADKREVVHEIESSWRKSGLSSRRNCRTVSSRTSRRASATWMLSTAETCTRLLHHGHVPHQIAWDPPPEPLPVVVVAMVDRS